MICNAIWFICHVNFRLMPNSHKFQIFELGLFTGGAAFSQIGGRRRLDGAIAQLVPILTSLGKNALWDFPKLIIDKNRKNSEVISRIE